MPAKMMRRLTALELEEQILNIGSLIAFIGVFLPWLGGEWLGGETVAYSGLQFYTGYLGVAILALHGYILLITIVPLTGGPVIVRKHKKEITRLLAASQATILTIAALSVLTRTTLDFARMELRFGIYITLIGSLITSLYSFLRFQEQQRKEVREMFHHPDDEVVHEPPITKEEKRNTIDRRPPPPPPPPAPSGIEDHRLR